MMNLVEIYSITITIKDIGFFKMYAEVIIINEIIGLT